MNNEEKFLEPFLEKYAQQFNIQPRKGNYVFQEVEYSGWYLKVGPDHTKTLFCLNNVSRKKIFEKTGENIKYLRRKDEGLTPILFLGNTGIPNPEITAKLENEGCFVGEGWKSGLIFSFLNLNFLAMGSCNGCASLIEFLNKYNIPKKCIKGIFADGDVLTNLKVTQAYRKIKDNFEDCPIYVHPPQKIISLEGGLNFDKNSPDDWITEDYTIEKVFQNVQEININLVENQLLTIVQKSTTTLKYKVSTKEKQKNLMIADIREFF